MKKLICLLLMMGCLVGCSQEAPVEEAPVEETPAVEEAPVEEKAEPEEVDLVATHTGTIVMEGLGEIKFELYGDIAPVTVENFVTLAQEGFYDGLIFHRVIWGFMIQGGDPTGTGTGGSDTKIQGEFSANGVENPISHTRGVLSMARSSSMDSASSQFFIMHKDYGALNGQYAAFGMVTEGMDVVDAIAVMETDYNDKPVEDVVITSITIDA